MLALLVCAMQYAAGFMPSTSRSVSRVGRGSTIVMDGKTRDLRDRIKSIKQTRRITEAMRLVAAARVRRAQEAVLKSRPLIAQLQLVYKTVLDACNQDDIELPILDVREVKKVSLVLVTGDRGLCGGYVLLFCSFSFSLFVYCFVYFLISLLLTMSGIARQLWRIMY